MIIFVTLVLLLLLFRDISLAEDVSAGISPDCSEMLVVIGEVLFVMGILLVLTMVWFFPMPGI
jgi:hypothetical protein